MKSADKRNPDARKRKTLARIRKWERRQQAALSPARRTFCREVLSRYYEEV